MTIKDQSGRPDEDSTEAHGKSKVRLAPSAEGAADPAETETEAHGKSKVRLAPSADVSDDEGTEGHSRKNRL